jgi:hypothetical protein
MVTNLGPNMLRLLLRTCSGLCGGAAGQLDCRWHNVDPLIPHAVLLSPYLIG